jgi:hypothetical protein
MPRAWAAIRPAVVVSAIALCGAPARGADAKPQSVEAAKAQCIAESEAAQKLALDQKLVLARPHFVACATSLCPVAVVRDCADQLAKLDASIATVVPSAHDLDTGRPLAFALRIDGAPSDVPADGRAIAIDPGVHQFEFELRGGQREEYRIAVAEGAKLLRVVASFDMGNAKRAPIPVSAWIIGGAGVAGVAMTAIFGIESLTQWETLHSEPGTEYTQADKAALETKEAITDVSLGVAVLGLGTATALILFRPKVHRSETSLPTLTFGPTSAVATWSLPL